MISVLILTKNEALDLPGALASVAWSDDIHVLDSFSTDATPGIARAAGAKLTQRPFDNWSAHQNWANANLPFQHPWVFYLDADERVTPELHRSLLSAAASPGDCIAFRMRRRDFFLGTWLRHVQTWAFYPRLFRPDKIRYERLVNPITVFDGPVGRIPGFLDHYPFSKGVGHWIARHNRYAALEAAHIIDDRRAHAPISLLSALAHPDSHRRHKQRKEIFYRLPLRPLIKFFILYILKRGFLDGRAGLRYAILQSIYEYFILIETDELLRGRDTIASPLD